MLADIVNKQCAHRTAVVGRGDGAVALLTSCVPDLRLDSLCVYLNRTGSELNTDCGLGVEVELIPSEPAEQVRFTDSRVSDEDDLGMLAQPLIRTKAGCTFEKELRLSVSIAPIHYKCNRHTSYSSFAMLWGG